MSDNRRPFDDPSETGRLETSRDHEDRKFMEILPTKRDASHPTDHPGRGVIEAALAEHDTALLRRIAAERKGLTDQQRRALLLLADLLDGVAERRGRHS